MDSGMVTIILFNLKIKSILQNFYGNFKEKPEIPRK